MLFDGGSEGEKDRDAGRCWLLGFHGRRTYARDLGPNRNENMAEADRLSGNRQAIGFILCLYIYVFTPSLSVNSE